MDKPEQGENLNSREKAEFITLKPESTPPVEKEIISDNRGGDNSSTAILAIFGSIAGLTILIGIGIALGPSDYNNNKSIVREMPEGNSLKPPQTAEEIIKKLGIGKQIKVAPGLAPPPPQAQVPEGAEKGNYQQAITEFNKLIELNPLDHAAYNSRGEAYQKLGNYQKAREDFNRAIIAINGGHEPNSEGFVALAKINKRFGLRLSSTEALRAKYYRNRGLAYEKLGNKNQAIKDLKIAARVGDKGAQKYLLSKEMGW